MCYEGDVHREPVIEDPGELKAIAPGAITVGAAFNVVYENVDEISRTASAR
jgi:hypothetical protein